MILTAEENMQSDFERLQALKEGERPSFRIYRWKNPSFTYGYFVKPEEWLDLERLKKEGYDWGRRPTGGGLLFHTHDLAFSVLIPKGDPKLSENTLENYQFINSIVKRAISDLVFPQAELLSSPQKEAPFCMASPTIYDVMIGQKKVGGAAQRRTKTGLLHQGTLCLSPPPFKDWAPFFKQKSILDQMEALSYPLGIPHDELALCLQREFEYHLGGVQFLGL